MSQEESQEDPMMLESLFACFPERLDLQMWLEHVAENPPLYLIPAMLPLATLSAHLGVGLFF